MDHDDASRVRGNRANVEVALDRVANLAEPGAQSASYEDESFIHGNSTATSPDLTRAVGDSQAMVSGPDTPAARENSDGHRNSPRKMPRVASSPALPTRATAPRPGSREMRDLFFVRPDAVNFNASYGTPAREVLEAQWRYHVECETSPHDWMLGVAARKIQAARASLASYVGADKADLALVENCTAATTACVRAAGIRAGDTVIHLGTAYGMVKNCLSHHCSMVGAESPVVVPVEFRGGGEAPRGAGGVPLELALADAIDDAVARGSRVALVTFDWIASCPGAVMPALELARVCRDRGVPALLDGAHVLGQISIDCAKLEAAGVTYLMADAHKWLFSPKGSAMLWVAKKAQAKVYPSVVGAVCSNTPTTNFDPAALAGLTEFERRFQYTGTRDYTPLIAVKDALDFRASAIAGGEAAIVGYNRSTAIWAQEWLAAVWRTETLLPAECTAFMAHARVPVATQAAATLLNRTLKEDRAIHVMAFALAPRAHRGESAPTYWVRPCMQLFVSRDDVRALGAAVLDLAPKCESAARCAAEWLAKTRARMTRNVNTVNNAAHKVTVGFSVPEGASGLGIHARSDSAKELGALNVNKTMEVTAVAKYSAGALSGDPQFRTFGTNPNVLVPRAKAGTLCNIAEERAATARETTGLFARLRLDSPVGSFGKRPGFAPPVPSRKPGFEAACSESPESVMDIAGTSAASSVDGAGFEHPVWLTKKTAALSMVYFERSNEVGLE